MTYRILSLLFALALLAGQVGLAPASASGAGVTAPAGETCVVLQPAPSIGVDAYIKQEKPDERRGTDPELRVKGENNKLKRSLLKFDLSSLPADATVSSATLSLYVKSASGGALTINARGLTRDWREAEVTWKAADKGVSWTNPGGDYGAIVSSTVVDDTKNVWRSWSIGSLVAGWKSNPASNFGVILEASGKNAEKVFKSSDDGTVSQRPKLEVCFSAGLTLTPNNNGEGVAGQAKLYPHVVTVGNMGPVAVSLSAVSNRGWITAIYKDVNGNGIKDPGDTAITQTPAIGPNASYPILVEVNIPVGVPLGLLDTTTVTASAGGKTATATDTTRVGQLLALQPNYTRKAVPGTTQFFGHVLFNNGDTRDCVTLSATSSLGWSVQLWEDTNRNGVHETSNPNEPAVSNPVCIDPGKAYYLVAEVTVPAGASAGATDKTVIRAASGAQPGKSAAATDTTTVVANVAPVVDGKYDEVYNVSPDAQVVCYNDQNGTLFGKLATFYQPTGNSVTMVLAIDKDFVDNTYGTNAINWPSGHDFSQLVGSDHAQFLGYDDNGVLVLDIKQDYISTASGTPSGYDSLGVTGGDGKVNKGSAAHILKWATSLDWNLNSTGYCSGGNCSAGGTNLLVNSPATDEFYTPNPTYPNWIYDVIYEIEISKAAFGTAGFGSLEVPYIHASPSKLGTNTIYAEPGVCPGEIGDTVWHDVNHDGVQDDGEPGLPGVQVKLYRDDGDLLFNPTNDVVVGTQTTNANGKYLFQNVPPGDYFAVVVDSTVPAGFIITTDNNPTPVFNLPEGGSYLDADFGYARAWGDYQVSKTLTSGNPGVVGDQITYSIRVTNTGATVINYLPLRDMFDPTKLKFVSATPAPNSASGGLLTWNDLTAASPNGFGRDLGLGQVFDVQLTFLALDSTMSLLAAAAAEPAGLQAEPVVDGLLDSNYSYLRRFDPPSADAPARLYGYAGANMCYWALVVDRSYNDNVYSETFGTYLSQDGWTQAHKFSNLLNSDNAVFNITYSGGSYSNLTLDYLNGTAGNWSSGQTSRDGSKAPGSPPIADAMTSLHWNLENSGWTNLTQSPPYNYNSTSGKYWEWAMIYEFSIPKSAMNGTCGTATLASAHNSPSKDKGMASIGDTVFGDVNRNGVQNTGEIGIPNVVVNLYQGSTLVRVTTTEPGPSGYYIFNNLAAGTYRVDVDESTLPPNYTLTTGNEPLTVTVATGQAFLTADFGYWEAGTGKIGDKVFYDLNRNGREDAGEPGINGVRVNLYAGACGTPGAALKASLVTSGNGDYLFTNLLQGTYCVNVDEATLPADHALTTGNEPLTVILGKDQAFLAADFGYQAQCPTGTPNLAVAQGVLDETGSTLAYRQGLACVDIEPARGSIGDTVFYDDDRSGGQNGNEKGIEGVTVRLYNTNQAGACNQVIATAVTDADGKYLFTDLRSGRYCVAVPENPNDNSALSNLERTAGSNPHIVNLGPNQNYLNADFGYAGRGTIRGVVYYDWNRDKAKGLNEQGIPNVRVCLYADADRNGVPDSSTPIACTTTGAQGDYLFNDNLPGNYVLIQTVPSGLFNSTPTVISTTLVIVQGSGLSDNNDFGNLMTVRLGDFVWVDINSNGVQDPGETTGLTGVPLRVRGRNVADESVDMTIYSNLGSYLVPDLLPGTYTVTAPRVFNNYKLTSDEVLSTTLTISRIEDLTLDFGYGYPTGLPVQDLAATAQRGQVNLTWRTLPEVGHTGFSVWRAESPFGPWTQVSTDVVMSVGNGEYAFTDTSVIPGRMYWYRLQTEPDGELYGPVAVRAAGGSLIFLPQIGR